jgi:hypothetical protein
MGIGEWFGFGKQEEARGAVPSVPRVPTADDLLAAVDRVEGMARDGAGAWSGDGTPAAGH